MKNYKVNHFVSDFLLEPWKSVYNSNRGLWCYDFDTQKISHRSPKRIFSRNRVFSPKTEERYNYLIENPISRFVKSLETSENLEITDWQVQRALYLIFLVQASRVEQALEPKSENSFNNFLKKKTHY